MAINRKTNESLEDLSQRQQEAEGHQGSERNELQHSKGKLTARERISRAVSLPLEC